MKILHVIPSFVPAWRYGGPIYSVLGLARGLARQGHEVTVMTTNVDGPGILDVPLERPVSLDGVEVWYFRIERPRWYHFSRPLGRALHQQVRRFDLVHIHSVFLWPTTIAALWCRRRKVPYIIEPHGMLDPVCLAKSYDTWLVSLMSRAKKQLYLTTLGRLDLQQASAIHFTSQPEMEAARPLGLRPPGFIVPVGVELEQAGGPPHSLPFRERYPRLHGKKVILFLSRLDPKKGLDLMIEALGELAARREDFAFVLAGSGTSAYEARLTALINSYGLEGRTIFLGHVHGDDKWTLLHQADLFVLPSYQENFGVAVVEAMAAGLPVIVSDRVNIHREVMEAGAGLVTGLDAGKIAVALEQLLEDANLRHEMGQRGKRLAGEQFSWEKIAREMVRVYEQIISGKHLGSARPTPEAIP